MYNSKWVGEKGRLFLKLRISEVEVVDANGRKKIFLFKNFGLDIKFYIIHM